MNAFLMTTAVALSPAAAADQPAPPTHEVRTGESLSSIAQCELGDGDRWTELAALNDDRIDGPDVIWKRSSSTSRAITSGAWWHYWGELDSKPAGPWCFPRRVGATVPSVLRGGPGSPPHHRPLPARSPGR